MSASVVASQTAAGICVDPQGHIQAIGTDVPGRRQYRYHDLWREQAVAEDQVCAVVRSLRRRRGGGDQLLAYRSARAGTMSQRPISTTICARYLGGGYTAKDFRTWHATVLAAVGLAVSEGASGRSEADLSPRPPN